MQVHREKIRGKRFKCFKFVCKSCILKVGTHTSINLSIMSCHYMLARALAPGSSTGGNLNEVVTFMGVFSIYGLIYDSTYLFMHHCTEL